MPLITVKRHKYSMVDIKTVISSKRRLRLIDSIKSMVITIKTTDLKRHRLYPTETHENRRQSAILPMKSFVWAALTTVSCLLLLLKAVCLTTVICLLPALNTA